VTVTSSMTSPIDTPWVLSYRVAIGYEPPKSLSLQNIYHHSCRHTHAHSTHRETDRQRGTDRQTDRHVHWQQRSLKSCSHANQKQNADFVYDSLISVERRWQHSAVTGRLTGHEGAYSL